MPDLSAPAHSRIFVGRAAELTVLGDVIAKAALGEPWLVTVEGEGGIGKTSLVRQFVADLVGCTVLWAQGDPSETDVSLGVIDQLLTRLPARLTAAYPALARAARQGQTHVAIGDQLLSLLGAAQTAGPVVLVLDDWQWADEASARVLGFVARRLWADAVVIILISRHWPHQLGEAHRRILDAGPQSVSLPVGGLGATEIVTLADRVGVPLSPDRVAAVRSATGGHTLYVRTVLNQMAAARSAGVRALPLPVASLDAVIRRQWRTLPQPARALLEALAVSNVRMPLVQVGSLADVLDPMSALADVLATGLVDREPTEVTHPIWFRHPIQRDAVYAAIDPERRRELHAAAAGMVGFAESWGHRVAAATGTDPTLAGELDELAERESAAGELVSAARHLLWAADLSAHRADVEGRTMRAALLLLASLQPGQADSLRPVVEGCAPSPLRSLLLGLFALFRCEFPTALTFLTEALAADPPIGLQASLGLAVAHVLLGNGQEAIDAGRAALAAGTGSQDRLNAIASIVSGEGFLHGPEIVRAALAEYGAPPPKAADAVPADSYLLAVRALFEVLGGQFTDAAADATMALRLSESHALLSEDNLAYYSLGLSQYLTGQWDDAVITSERSVIVAYTEGKVWSYAMAHALAAAVYAGRGEWEQAEAAERDARRSALEVNPEVNAALAMLASGYLAQARGDHAALYAATAPVRAVPRPLTGWWLCYEPLWRPLYVEALVGTGRLAQAGPALAELAALAERIPYLRLVTAWLAGWLADRQGDPRQARQHYERGVAVPVSADDVPLHRALLEQAHGQLLAAGSDAAAVTWLDRALRRYSSLDARPFAERCRLQLASAGAPRPSARAESPLAALTVREKEIAHLIGRGLTNREIATSLFITGKTVEYHLGHIYAKLAIGNRRALRDLVQHAPATEHPASGV
jgi:DNA-binding CsgD family transcriptional regulator/tetratricopeptide (TPR) repeat protein